MRLARLLRTDDPDRPPLSRRAVALGLTILAHIGLLLLLLSLTPERVFVPVAPPPGTLTVTLDQEAQQQAAKPAARAPAKSGAKARPSPPTAPPPSPTPPPVPVPEQPKALPGVLYLSKAELDAADISRLPQGEKQANAGAGAGAASGAGDTPTVGKGRNGQPLYAAEWVREPTDAEIGGYLRRGPPPRGAWAEIACQTVARNRVDDCEALGDSPPGSGLANMMVEAAWQFLVRPPRVGGHAMVGTWVRIHISWSRGDAAG